MGKRRWIIGFLLLILLLWAYLFKAEKSRSQPPAFFLPQQPSTSTTAPTPKEFPCVLRGSRLIAQELSGYRGSEILSPVSGIAALTVYNPSNQVIEKATLQLVQGSVVLVFELSGLAPGEKQQVLEKNFQQYTGQPVTACRCTEILIASANT